MGRVGAGWGFVGVIEPSPRTVKLTLISLAWSDFGSCLNNFGLQMASCLKVFWGIVQNGRHAFRLRHGDQIEVRASGYGSEIDYKKRSGKGSPKTPAKVDFEGARGSQKPTELNDIGFRFLQKSRGIWLNCSNGRFCGAFGTHLFSRSLLGVF